mmetsp:Transcript_29530/g.82521  ORF Transcript_29530/g.82521 Transcript_29530/m.82521 type:complete len:247 (-) Transcript_29530:1736-2476(-)
MLTGKLGWRVGRGLAMYSTRTNHKIAVVLAGCGYLDGTEVTEAVALQTHLSRAGADVHFFAPSGDQMHVVDHQKGEPDEGAAARNILNESARITRGNVSSLRELAASDFDAVFFPGGFGAAKNLSNFAVKGDDYTVHEDVEQVIRDFHANQKPISLCCIAPILAARVLPNCEVTLGMESDSEDWPYAGCIGALPGGTTHVNKDISGVHVDEDNRVVTAPAFMYNGKFHEIYDSVGNMVDETLRLIK